MPRIPRVCAEGYPHHITQRGNNKEKTFFSDEDKRYYLDTLQRYKDKYKLKILAYCIMSNHVPQKVGRQEERQVISGNVPIYVLLSLSPYIYAMLSLSINEYEEEAL